MSFFTSTVFRLCSASILCAIIQAISRDWKGQKQTITLVCGLMLLAILLQPLRAVIPGNLFSMADARKEEAYRLVNSAKADMNEALSSVITERTASYIMDKAAGLGADIEVAVRTDESCIPCTVRISGSVSPYARSRLESILEHDLGIPRSQQEWNE